MHLSVRGLVLKSVNIGESDRLITIFSRECGNITAMVRGSRTIKSRHMAPTQQFCYSDIVLYQRGDKYYVKEASLIESFFHIRDSIEGLSLAGYVVEVLSDVTTAEREEELLRLSLNSLYAIAEKKYPLDRIKAAFELRTCAIIGFMPDILYCRDCQGRHGDFFFDIMAGNIQCMKCRDEVIFDENISDLLGERRIIALLSEGTKIAMEYIIYSPIERIFSFSLSREDMSLLSRAAEDYIVNQLERSFKSLEFYKEVKA